VRSGDYSMWRSTIIPWLMRYCCTCNNHVQGNWKWELSLNIKIV
jgi:hypothetical protein